MRPIPACACTLALLLAGAFESGSGRAQQDPPNASPANALQSPAPMAGGELRVVGDPAGPQAFPLKHTEVHAEITGSVAQVHLSQVFQNPYDRAIEAIYVFPLPPRAAVDDMEIQIGDRTIRGLIKRREEARALYDEARR